MAFRTSGPRWTTAPSHAPSQTDASPTGERLDSWKEIAAYLKRSVRTVHRWEKEEGLPVHRQLHKNLGSVFAYRSELDAWSSARSVHAGPREETDERASAKPYRLIVAARPGGFSRAHWGHCLSGATPFHARRDQGRTRPWPASS